MNILEAVWWIYGTVALLAIAITWDEVLLGWLQRRKERNG